MAASTPAGGIASSVVPGHPFLLVVDGHAYAYRAFHAIRSLSAPDGAPTNAIYGFIKMLGKLRSRIAPSHLVVIWDGGLASERLALLPAYKAQRPPMPDSLERQIDGIVEYCAAAGIASWCRDGVEADDWIGAVARGAERNGLPVAVASSDKDFMQLVSPGIGLVNPNDKEDRIWTSAEVLAKSGVQPEQIVDWLSLVGDAVDNIPGVPGVGPKTAAQLLQQFGSIQSLYTRLEEVASVRVRAALEAARGDVQRNQEMVRLLDPDAGEFDPSAVEIRPPDPVRLAELYARWGFRTLAAELAAATLGQGQLL